MMRFNTSLLVIVIALVALLASSCLAQQCKNRNPFADPAPCPSCTFCTATKSSSCCTAAEDSAASLGAAFAQLISTGCYDLMKMGACAICDPKNQQYVVNGTLVVCKSACQRATSACGGATSACDSMPTTDCWSGAVVQKMTGFVVVAAMMTAAIFLL
ncbi:hypothetical protein FDP41_000594 [Naegleria fowleri]|uniref:Uncharacterized protein n=1 Tax=Naegleria fowleri TaxID=5763 RepID=A0A6A5CHC9_NAEFO|nr:uncharacterized protein FDP41_000594 [Naegleria fowleri]KAF0984695.1 hypothetical protein FDP41_000594 [Naegleria fowleri]